MVRCLLSGLLAEGQEEVCAQWLRKVHLQVCPHEQLEDIIANGLRRARREKSVEGREGTGWRRKGNRAMAGEAGEAEVTEVKGLVGAGTKRPGGDRESGGQGTGDGTQTEKTWWLTIRHRVGFCSRVHFGLNLD